MKIEITGYIIRDDDQWIYDLYEITATSPSKVNLQLKQALSSGEPVEVDIDSPGGYVTDGARIYSMLKAHPTPVTVNVVGMAASSASLIAMAGSPTRISPAAMIMIHNASTTSEGDYRDHEKTSEVLKQVNKSLITAYQLKTGLEESEIQTMMDAETYFTANEAVEKGFADEMMFQSQKTPARFAASATLLGMIPEKVLNGMKAAKEGTKPAGSTPEPPPAQPKPAEPEQKEAPKAMDLEKFKAEHSELYNQIVAEAAKAGATSERTRITDLNDMASAPGAAAIVAEAITNGDTPEMTAMKIVKNSKERIEKVGEARSTDAQNSGTAKVEASEAPFKDETDEDKEARALEERYKKAAQSVNKKGGRV